MNTSIARRPTSSVWPGATSCSDYAEEQLGFHGDAAEAYAREVIYSDLEEPGEDDMFHKVTADFERHGKTVTREQLAAKLGACLNEAQEQIR